MMAPLTSTLVPQIGALSSFSRSTAAMVPDMEGIIKWCKINEARFEGARRVENACASSENIQHTSWTSFGTIVDEKTFTVTGTSSYLRNLPAPFLKSTASGTLNISFEAKSDTPGFKINVAANNTLAWNTYTGDVLLTLTSNWVRYNVKVTKVPGSLGLAIYALFGDKKGDNTSAGASIGTFNIRKIQIEDCEGETNQNPSEYVSTNILSTPFHGAGVDGVKYFETLNGNTVVSNIVTEATGAAIPSATLKGFLSEAQATNYCLYSNDFSNAAWVKTTMTATFDAVGPAGKANMASTLTATAANATALQSITRSSALRISSLWVKRRTGSGVVNMTQDNGVTWTPITVTAGWTRVSIPSATAANPVVGIQIVTNADAIDVAYFQHEEGTYVFPTSEILTTSAATTRTADTLKYIKDGFIKDGQGSIILTVNPKWSTRNSGGNEAIYLRESGAGQGLVLGIYSWPGADNVLEAERGNTVTTNEVYNTATIITANILMKLGMTYSDLQVSGYRDGASLGDIVKTNSYSNITLLDIGPNANARIKNLKIYSKALPPAKMVILTVL